MALIDNLVSYWEMEESSGSTRVDIHASNDLTDNNTVAQGTGKLNNGADFEGSSGNQRLTRTDASFSGFPAGAAFSLSAWVNTESTAQQPLACKWNHASSDTFLIECFGDAFRVFIADAASDPGNNYFQSGSGIFSNGTFVHVVVVFDGAGGTNADRLKTYKDGSLIVSGGYGGTIPATLIDSSAVFEVGGHSSLGRWFDGVIDEVGLWDRALSSTEVSDLYNGGAGLAYPLSVGGGALPILMNHYRRMRH